VDIGSSAMPRREAILLRLLAMFANKNQRFQNRLNRAILIRNKKPYYS
jgi:hypothetical protein